MSKKRLRDFESAYPSKQAMLSDIFFKDYNFEDSQKEEVEKVIQDNPFLDQLYKTGKLYIGSKYRDEGQKIITKNLSKLELNLDERNKKKRRLEEFYDSSQKVAEIVTSRIKDVKEYQDKTDLARDYNNHTISVLMSRNPTFSVSIELFPDIEFDQRIIRSDCYDPSTSFIEFCPTNFPNTGIPPRNPASELFAHELAHAIDDLVNDPSITSLEANLRSYYPDLKKDRVEIQKALEFASLLASRDISRYYSLMQIVDDNGTFNRDVDAVAEFVSYHAEKIAKVLNESASISEFEAKYSKRINDIVKGNSGLTNLKGKLFSLDSMNAYTKDYKEALTVGSQSIKQVFQTVNQVFNKHIDSILNEISKAIIQDMSLEPLKAILEGEITKEVNSKTIGIDFTSPVEEIVKSILDNNSIDLALRKNLEAIAYTNHEVLPVLKANAPEKYYGTILEKRFIEPKRDQYFKYIESAITAQILDRKVQYIAQNAGKIQAEIVASQSKLETLKSDISKKNESLDNLKKELAKDPDDPDLQEQKRQLENEINEAEKNQQAVEDDISKKQDEARQNDASKNENDTELEKKRQDKADSAKEFYGE